VYGGTATEDPAYGRRLEFDGVEWTVAGGDPADKPLGQNWIGDETARAAYGHGGRHKFAFVTFDQCTDAEELLQLTYNELQARKVPQTTYEMSVIVLEEISGYEHEAVRLGDTVNIINTAVSPAITGQARVIRIDRSYIDPADCNVVLGNYIPTSYNTISKIQQQQNLMLDRSGVWDRANAISAYDGELSGLENKINLLKTQLYSTVTNFYTDENGNFIWENATQDAALKIGAGIFAIANSKTGGEYNWRTFGTGAGFTADEISAGTLNAAIIFAGILQAASGTFANLIAGIEGAQRMELGSDENNDPYMRFFDNNNVLKMTLTKNGVKYGENSEMRIYEAGDVSGIGFFAS
jgi:hypothetical protein